MNVRVRQHLDAMVNNGQSAIGNQAVCQATGRGRGRSPQTGWWVHRACCAYDTPNSKNIK